MITLMRVIGACKLLKGIAQSVGHWRLVCRGLRRDHTSHLMRVLDRLSVSGAVLPSMKNVLIILKNACYM